MELLHRAKANVIIPSHLVAELDRRYNAMLSYYVNHPEHLRTVLDETESALAGSFVLRFLEGILHWPRGDLDVCVDKNNTHRMIAVFVDEGYKRVQHTDQQEASHAEPGTIRQVIHMHRDGPGGERKVDIIVSNNKTSLVPIANFWATHVMNFLTGSALYVAYPDTFLKKAVVSPTHKREWDIPILIAKYIQRGFTFYEPKPDSLGQTRYFGDKQGWTIPTKEGGKLFCVGRVAETVVWEL